MQHYGIEDVFDIWVDKRDTFSFGTMRDFEPVEQTEAVVLSRLSSQRLLSSRHLVAASTEPWQPKALTYDDAAAEMISVSQMAGDDDVDDADIPFCKFDHYPINQTPGCRVDIHNRARHGCATRRRLPTMPFIMADGFRRVQGPCFIRGGGHRMSERLVRADFERTLARLHIARIIDDFGPTPASSSSCRELTLCELGKDKRL